MKQWVAEIEFKQFYSMAVEAECKEDAILDSLDEIKRLVKDEYFLGQLIKQIRVRKKEI